MVSVTSPSEAQHEDEEFAALRGSIRSGPHPSEHVRAPGADEDGPEDVVPEVVHDSDADDEAPPAEEVGPNGDVDMGAVIVDQVRREPPQPGRPGIGNDVVRGTLQTDRATPGSEPAVRLSTRERARRQAT